MLLFSVSMKRFRLGTLNVHQFNKPKNFDDNLTDLIEILQPVQLDLLAVQEVINDHRWSTLCQRLSLPHSIFADCGYSSFGNGIASRFPIASHLNHRSNTKFSSEIRSLLECTFETVDYRSFFHDRRFAVTHLDYLSEPTRLDQLKHFDPLTKNIDILMGDFNALTREDYSDEFLQKRIVDVRQKCYWEEAFFDLTKLITKTWEYRDAFRMVNRRIKDEQLITCRFDTRIDYIYLRPRVNDRWQLEECFIHNTRGATDHHLVVATFHLKI